MNSDKIILAILVAACAAFIIWRIFGHKKNGGCGCGSCGCNMGGKPKAGGKPDETEKK
jgi:hypothetical protein